MAELLNLTAVRAAVHGLTQAVDDLRREAGDTVEVRRLAVDTARIAEDVASLPGGQVVEPTPAGQPIHIPDGDYPPEFWADAADEGVGRQ